MANIIYNEFLDSLADGTLNWTSATIKVMLVRNTSGYTASATHTSMSQVFTLGLVEISAASYTRQTLAGKTRSKNDTSNRIVFDATDVSFGSLESGQTVSGVMIYAEVAGTATYSDDIPAIYLDTATILPAILADDTFTVVWSSDGIFYQSQY